MDFEKREREMIREYLSTDAERSVLWTADIIIAVVVAVVLVWLFIK